MTLATSLLEVPLLRNRGGTAAAGANRACRTSALRQTQHRGQQGGLRRTTAACMVSSKSCLAAEHSADCSQTP